VIHHIFNWLEEATKRLLLEMNLLQEQLLLPHQALQQQLQALRLRTHLRLKPFVKELHQLEFKRLY
jgi:hypothetical protein